LLKLKEKVLSHLVFCSSNRKVRDHEEDFHQPLFASGRFSRTARIRTPKKSERTAIQPKMARNPRLLGIRTENYSNAAGSSFFPSTFLFTTMLHQNETILLGDITSVTPGFLDSKCKDIVCAHEINEFLLLVMIETTNILGDTRG
jgi:hypothetical protein